MRADAIRNRELIVEAAIVVFGQQGFDAPLAAVAREAGVGQATLHRRFDTRADLVDAVRLASLDRLVERSRAARDGETRAVDALDRVIGYTPEARLLSRSTSRGALALPPAGQRALDELREITSALLAQAIEDGDVRADVGVGDVLFLTLSIADSRLADTREGLLAMTRAYALVRAGLRAPAEFIGDPPEFHALLFSDRSS